MQGCRTVHPLPIQEPDVLIGEADANLHGAMLPEVSQAVLPVVGSSYRLLQALWRPKNEGALPQNGPGTTQGRSPIAGRPALTWRSLVGVAGFEPTASSSRTRYRHGVRPGRQTNQQFKALVPVGLRGLTKHGLTAASPDFLQALPGPAPTGARLVQGLGRRRSPAGPMLLT